jgi:hypothetical protein
MNHPKFSGREKIKTALNLYPGLFLLTYDVISTAAAAAIGRNLRSHGICTDCSNLDFSLRRNDIITL